MPRTCTVCRHRDRHSIDQSLLAGQPSLRDIARQWGLSKDALHRHLRRHLPLLGLGRRALCRPPVSGSTPIKEQFLRLCELKLSVTQVCAEMGIDRSTPYRWRERDAEFATAMDWVRSSAIERLEESLFDRAMAGNVVAGIFLLKAHKPEVYSARGMRENAARAVEAAEGDSGSVVGIRFVEGD